MPLSGVLVPLGALGPLPVRTHGHKPLDSQDCVPGVSGTRAILNGCLLRNTYNKNWEKAKYFIGENSLKTRALCIQIEFVGCTGYMCIHILILKS